MKLENKEERFMKFTSDTMFKEMFAREENKELLALILAIYFKEDYKDVYKNIKHLNPNLNINTLNDYKYKVDILVSLNENINVGVELNKDYWDGLYERNLAYISNQFSNQFKKGTKKEDFKLAKKFIQLNINAHNFPENKEYGIYRFKDIQTNEELTDLIEIHHINLVEISKLRYNRINELEGYQKLAKLMLSESIEDVERMCNDMLSDEELEEVKSRIKGLNCDDNLYLIYNQEELDRQKFESMLEAGINQSKIEIVKNLLNMNMKIDDISKATGLSIEEINNIKNNKE